MRCVEAAVLIAGASISRELVEADDRDCSKRRLSIVTETTRRKHSGDSQVAAEIRGRNITRALDLLKVCYLSTSKEKELKCA